MNVRSLLCASALLLPFLPAQDVRSGSEALPPDVRAGVPARLPSGVPADVAVGVPANVPGGLEPGSIVIERGGDRIVIKWRGAVPQITINDKPVQAADPKQKPDVVDFTVDGYTVNARPNPVVDGFGRLPLLDATAFSRGVDTINPLTVVWPSTQWGFTTDLNVVDGTEWNQKGAQLPSGEPVCKPYIGVQVGSVPAPLADHLEIEAEKCVLILDVTDGGPAAKAGLRKNDILTGVDASESVTDETLRAAVGKKRPGEVIKLRFVRRGRERELNVTVGEKQQERGLYWNQAVQPDLLNGYWTMLSPDVSGFQPTDSRATLLPTFYQQADQQSVQEQLKLIRTQLKELSRKLDELKR